MEIVSIEQLNDRLAEAVEAINSINDNLREINQTLKGLK